ncbi:MAG: hypothetical protein KDK70_17000, partial [Myxococcales bacterium]|nr:hypothetical protein [Myxococcales bacterium]
MPTGFDFCPVCGQDQRVRLQRPPTRELNVRGHGQAPASAKAPPVVRASVPPPPPPPSATAAGRTEVA